MEGRPDPIDLLHTSDVGRMEKLIPIRYGRMLQSPFSFYRGSAGIMAADLARTPITGLKVQACGDCHVFNFGGFATPERSIVFDINDFDETLPGPWEWDIKRLVASITLAARSNGLSDTQGHDCAVNCARMYREHMHKFSRMDPLRIWYEETSATEFIKSLPEGLQKHVKKRIEKTAAHSGSEFDLPKLTGSVGGGTQRVAASASATKDSITSIARGRLPRRVLPRHRAVQAGRCPLAGESVTRPTKCSVHLSDKSLKTIAQCGVVSSR